MEAATHWAREPAETPPYALLESLYETVKGAWESLFEQGFAHIRCPDCAEYLLAFITELRVLRRILDHLSASTRCATQGRAPPPAALPAPAFP